MFTLSPNEGLTLVTLGAIALVLLGVGVFLSAGLFQARSLVRREFGAYFLSPIAYVVLVVFLLVTGHLFYLTLQLLTETGPRGAEFPMQVFFDSNLFWFVFVLIPPLLTMRLFAEERGSGTLEMLLTAPLRDWQVVLSKYAACLAFYLLLWVPTFAYLPVLLDLHRPVVHPDAWTPWSIALAAGLGAVVLAGLSALPRLGTPARTIGLVLLLGGLAAAGAGFYGHYTYDPVHLVEVPAGIDPMPVVASYLGLALAGAMFLALGMFVSSLVRSQLVAGLVSAVCLFVFALGFWVPPLDVNVSGARLLAGILTYVTVPLHFKNDFARGLVDTRHLVLYGSVAVCSLFLTVRSLESRRWR
jgi:ABC-type transport system involved in multi-copper enzyme maturation permease subunit